MDYKKRNINGVSPTTGVILLVVISGLIAVTLAIPSLPSTVSGEKTLVEVSFNKYYGSHVRVTLNEYNPKVDHIYVTGSRNDPDEGTPLSYEGGVEEKRNWLAEGDSTYEEGPSDGGQWLLTKSSHYGKTVGGVGTTSIVSVKYAGEGTIKVIKVINGKETEVKSYKYNGEG